MMNDEQRNFYVFRIAKGFDGGEPSSSCPVDMEEKKASILELLARVEVELIPYETNNYIDFLHRELWQCGKLRQGWGFEGLDLHLFEEDRSKWIENFIVGVKKYWDVDVNDDYCHVAMGRYSVLKHMVDAKRGDIVFIPKHSFDLHHDENRFTVCEVVGSYYFDLDRKYMDFGHTIIVRNLKAYEYGEDTLLPGDFSGYRKALGIVKAEHQLAKNECFTRFLALYRGQLS